MPAATELTMSVSDAAELRSLRKHLDRIPEVKVDQLAGSPATGELGATDVLQVLIPSVAVLGIMIRTLPDFIRSRRSSITVTIQTGERMVTVTGENLDDPESVIDRLLDDDA